MAKKKQRHPAPNQRDRHHLLFTRRTWTGCWAKCLREHPYTSVRIPRKAMHDSIHEHCLAIPPPPEWVCEAVWHELNDMQDLGLIGKHDDITQRLTVLIEEFKCFEGTEYTVQMLEWQRKIVQLSRRGDI